MPLVVWGASEEEKIAVLDVLGAGACLGEAGLAEEGGPDFGAGFVLFATGRRGPWLCGR